MSNWNNCSIGDLGLIVGGATPSSKNKNNYLNGNISWITPKDLSKSNSRYISKGERNITEEGLNSCSSKLLPKGSVLFSSRAPIGYVGIAQNELCTNQGFKSIVPNRNNDSLFIYYLLKFYAPKIEKSASGSTFKEISGSDLKAFKVRVPNITIQKNIAGVLNAIDSKIENNNKINAELESLAKTIYDYWFLQFEFPNEEGKPYKSSGGKMVANEKLNRMIPDGWKNGNLYDIAEFTNGLACQKHRPIKNNQRLPVIKIREMHNGFTSETEWVRDDIPQKYVIDDGDILFSWSATLETIIWTGGQGALNQHIFKVSEKNCAKYYVFMQLAEYVKNFVAMAEARKTTMGHITSDHLNQSRVVLPCTKVIDSFEQKVTPLFTSIIKNKQESIELSKLREFLLPLLMNGQVGFIENE